MGGPGGIAGDRPRGRAEGPRGGPDSVAVRDHAVRCDCSLPPTLLLAPSSGPGLHVADGPDTGLRRPRGGPRAGAAGGDRVGPPPTAPPGILGSVVLPHP